MQRRILTRENNESGLDWLSRTKGDWMSCPRSNRDASIKADANSLFQSVVLRLRHYRKTGVRAIDI